MLPVFYEKSPEVGRAVAKLHGVGKLQSGEGRLSQLARLQDTWNSVWLIY